MPGFFKYSRYSPDFPSILQQPIAIAGVNELISALEQLDADSYFLIHSLYLDKEKKTEREMASLLGVSQAAINKRKKKILKTLKFLVIKIQKSSQYKDEGIN